MQKHSYSFDVLRSFAKNHKFSNKNNHFPAWRKIGNIFFAICTRPNSPVRFEGKNDVLYESVKYLRHVIHCIVPFLKSSR